MSGAGPPKKSPSSASSMSFSSTLLSSSKCIKCGLPDFLGAGAPIPGKHCCCIVSSLPALSVAGSKIRTPYTKPPADSSAARVAQASTKPSQGKPVTQSITASSVSSAAAAKSTKKPSKPSSSSPSSSSSSPSSLPSSITTKPAKKPKSASSSSSSSSPPASQRKRAAPKSPLTSPQSQHTSKKQSSQTSASDSPTPSASPSSAKKVSGMKKASSASSPQPKKKTKRKIKKTGGCSYKGHEHEPWWPEAKKMEGLRAQQINLYKDTTLDDQKNAGAEMEEMGLSIQQKFKASYQVDVDAAIARENKPGWSLDQVRAMNSLEKIPAGVATPRESRRRGFFWLAVMFRLIYQINPNDVHGIMMKLMGKFFEIDSDTYVIVGGEEEEGEDEEEDDE